MNLQANRGLKMSLLHSRRGKSGKWPGFLLPGHQKDLRRVLNADQFWKEA
jgi:hypothetical protein